MITLFYFVFEGNFQVEAPWGLYSEGRFCVTSLGGGGGIFGGAYTLRGVFSEFYGTNFIQNVNKLIYRKNIVLKDILKRELRG